MSEMILFIVCVVILVGGFMWVRPSKHDQQLAQLRSQALAYGFRLGSLKIRDLTDAGRVNASHQIKTMYYLPLIVNKTFNKEVVVVRTQGVCGIYLPEGWDWEVRTLLQREDYQRVAQLVATLPDAVEVLQISHEGHLGIAWKEDPAEIEFEQLASYLIQLADIFQQQVLQ